MRVDCDLPVTYSKLPEDFEVSIFHVVQEGLMNAHRHSGSPWAKVSLSVDTAEARVSVENEITREIHVGAAAKTPRIGVGMRSLNERVEYFGGRCALRHDTYRTVLEAVVPLPRMANTSEA
jgi:signal transduction histidine kinase